MSDTRDAALRLFDRLELVLYGKTGNTFERNRAEAAIAILANALADAAAPVGEMSASEALYAFAGWLTTRQERTVMSARDWATPVADRVAEFCKHHGLAEPREGWAERIKTHPPEVPHDD